MFLYQSSFFENRDWIFANLSTNQSNYSMNSLFFAKIMVVSFSIFLFGSSFQNKSLSLHVNTTQTGKDLSKFMNAKIFVNLAVISLFVMVLWSLCLMIGRLVLEISTPNHFIFVGISLLEESIIFGWISAMLMMIIQHPMSNILGFSLFWGIEIISSTSETWMVEIAQIWPSVKYSLGGYIVQEDQKSSAILLTGLFVLLFVFASRFRRDVSNREE